MTNSMMLFVGSLNRELPYMASWRGKGIASFAFDDDTGALSLLSETGDIDNPSFLTVAADGRTLYASSELWDRHEGLVSAYAVAADGGLSYLNQQPTLGSTAAQHSLTADGQHLLLANYHAFAGPGPRMSAVAFPLASDGSLSPASGMSRHEGTGPNAERQEQAHCHSIQPVGPAGAILAADLGTDELVSYALDDRGGLVRQGAHALAPGSGPRHVACSADGTLVFVICELSSTVHALRREADGTLTEVSRQSAVPEGTIGSHCADLHLSPDGRFLYGSNRGHDTIAIFEVSADGVLIPHGHEPTRGQTPRNFAISPSGRHLLVGNQDSDTIMVFRRDAESGGLRFTGHGAEIGTPVCLKLAPRPA